jgi:hypothetical protein
MHVESLCLEEGVENQLAEAAVCYVVFEKKCNHIFLGGNSVLFFLWFGHLKAQV